MCDYALGLSRQLSGSIIPSEREYPVRSQIGMSNVNAIDDFIAWLQQFNG